MLYCPETYHKNQYTHSADTAEECAQLYSGLPSNWTESRTGKATSPFSEVGHNSEVKNWEYPNKSFLVLPPPWLPIGWGREDQQKRSWVLSIATETDESWILIGFYGAMVIASCMPGKRTTFFSNVPQWSAVSPCNAGVLGSNLNKGNICMEFVWLLVHTPKRYW